MRFGPDVPPHERRPVAWYAPAVLWQAARKLIAAEQFASHLDRRETFAPDLQPIDLSADAGPFWFDFLSDTGDGGDATFSVAQAALAPNLAGTQAVDERGLPLPAGRLLVLGGDLAYPGSGRLDYQYRFIEPFEQAQAWAATQPGSRWVCRPDCQRGGQALAADDKVLTAIPQNHDWAVSASVFCRYFVNQDRGAVLGMRTPQRQTWFAARLPRDWWLLGLDFALDGDIDRQQYESFRELLADGRLGPTSQIILVYPEPYWTRPLGDGAPEGYPKRYQRLEAQLLAAGAAIRIRLAGDLHHYAHDRLQLADGSHTHLIVAGHGGAFTHATHTVETTQPKHLRSHCRRGSGELASHVEVGLADSAADRELPAFETMERYPDRRWSRLWAWKAWVAPFACRSSGVAASPRVWLLEQWESNRGLLPLMGLGVSLLTWFGWGIRPEIDLQALAPSPSVVLPALALWAAGAAALWEPLAPRRALLLGVAHGAAQLMLAWLLTLVCFGPLNPWLAWPAFWGLASLGSGLLLGGALAIACSVFGLASNACSGLIASERHKGFLRFRLDDQGLTVFALGLDRVPAQRQVPVTGPLPPRWRVVERFRV